MEIVKKLPIFVITFKWTMQNKIGKKLSLAFSQYFMKHSLFSELMIYSDLFIIYNITFEMTKQINNNWNWQNENMRNKSTDAMHDQWIN